MRDTISQISGTIRPDLSRAAPARPRWRAPVLLFTPIKPPEYVARVARIFLEYPHAKAERLLAREMVVITENLHAVGADPVEVAAEVRKLESSIRVAMWHLVMGNTR